jgi:hypothetical protein
MADDNSQNQEPPRAQLAQQPAVVPGTPDKTIPYNKIPAYVTPQVPPSEQYPDPMKTEEGQRRQAEVNQYQEALKQQLEDSQKLQKRFDDFDTRYQEGMRNINQEIADIDKQRATPPQLTPLNQRLNFASNCILFKLINCNSLIVFSADRVFAPDRKALKFPGSIFSIFDNCLWLMPVACKKLRTRLVNCVSIETGLSDMNNSMDLSLQLRRS